MILLITKAMGTLARYADPHLGRLVQPRHYDGLKAMVEAGIPWAADNDCFQGFRPAEYLKMVQALPTENNLFVTVPDVVADHEATLKLWREWAPVVKDHGFGPSFVLQNGCESLEQVPDDASSVFIGGTTDYKYSHTIQPLIKDAREKGLWVHMGRVNSQKRIVYAASIGCQSVDGTGFSKYSDRDIPLGLTACKYVLEQDTLW